MDTQLIQELRLIFNAFLLFPERNHNPFGANLVFDPNANLIQRTMAEHILRSFGSTAWSKDPELTRNLRTIFNDLMKPPR